MKFASVAISQCECCKLLLTNSVLFTLSADNFLYGDFPPALGARSLAAGHIYEWEFFGTSEKVAIPTPVITHILPIPIPNLCTFSLFSHSHGNPTSTNTSNSDATSCMVA